MIKKIFLHIGCHKTGTTSIQEFLTKNRKRLRNNNSIDYYNNKKQKSFTLKKQDLSIDLKKTSKLKDITSDYVIISDEDFSAIKNKQDISNLAKELYKYASNIEVIIYIRRQDSLAISFKQQGAKGSLLGGYLFGHELKALPTNTTFEAVEYLNFNEKVKKWASIFKKENIRIRIFEKDQLYNGDVVEDFCHIIGIENYGQLVPLPRFKNRSLNKTQHLFLHKSHLLREEYFLGGTKERDFLIKVLNKNTDDEEKLLPPKNEAQIFYKQFKESNKKLNEWFKLNNKQYLFSEDFDFYPEVGNEYELKSEDILDIFYNVTKRGLKEDNELKLKNEDIIDGFYEIIQKGLKEDDIEKKVSLKRKLLEYFYIDRLYKKVIRLFMDK